MFAQIYPGQSDASSTDFLRRLKRVSPIRITQGLTENGSQFTDRFTAKDKRPSGKHAFDRECALLGIEHRLTPPRSPQTIGMVERFSGRISDVLATTRFRSSEDLETTILRYIMLYDEHLPQRALGQKTPLQALQQWHRERPDLFVKQPRNQPGPDT